MKFLRLLYLLLVTLCCYGFIYLGKHGLIEKSTALLMLVVPGIIFLALQFTSIPFTNVTGRALSESRVQELSKAHLGLVLDIYRAEFKLLTGIELAGPAFKLECLVFIGRAGKNICLLIDTPAALVKRSCSISSRYGEAACLESSLHNGTKRWIYSKDTQLFSGINFSELLENHIKAERFLNAAYGEPVPIEEHGYLENFVNGHKRASKNLLKFGLFKTVFGKNYALAMKGPIWERKR